MNIKPENAEIARQAREFINSKFFLDPLPGTVLRWVFDRWELYAANVEDRPPSLPTNADTFKVWKVENILDACQVFELLSGIPHPPHQVEAVLKDPGGPIFVGVYALLRDRHKI